MNIDIGPTILNMAGFEMPKQVQEYSLLSLYKKYPQPKWRDAEMFSFLWIMHNPLHVNICCESRGHPPVVESKIEDGKNIIPQKQQIL